MISALKKDLDKIRIVYIKPSLIADYKNSMLDLIKIAEFSRCEENKF